MSAMPDAKRRFMVKAPRRMSTFVMKRQSTRYFEHREDAEKFAMQVGGFFYAAQTTFDEDLKPDGERWVYEGRM